MSFLKEHWALLKSFLKGSFRRIALICAMAFLVIAAVGAGCAMAYPEIVEQILEGFQQVVEQAGVIEGDGSFNMFALLKNNWNAMLMSLLYGVFPVSFLPLISLFSNAFLVGVMGGWYATNGLTVSAYLAGLLPHGIFEIPALILAISCGICLSVNSTRILLRHPKRVKYLDMVCDLLRVMLFLVAPLTVAAAVVECYLTPVIMGLFL